MKLLFYTEARFIKAKDGKIYNPKGVQNKMVFSRYLDVFENILVVARVIEDNEYDPKESEIVSSDNIQVYELPYYLGIKQFFFKRKLVRSNIKQLVLANNSAAHILRLPGAIGYIAYKYLKKGKYGVEVVGDPYDIFAVNFIKNPLLYFIRIYSYFKLKIITKKAEASIYVTAKTLQFRYPSNQMFNASNVNISKKDILVEPKKSILGLKNISIISIGTLEQMYKSPDILIKTIGVLKSEGYNPILTWVGDGKYKAEMIKLSEKLNLNDNIIFKGYISNRNEIIKLLDKSDIFVLASSTEGLPRVIIEAFARGLPVIGTNVGGIPELIDSEMLVEVNDYEMIAEKIKILFSNKSLYEEYSLKNLELSKMYEESKLQENRIKFYEKLL